MYGTRPTISNALKFPLINYIDRLDFIVSCLFVYRVRYIPAPFPPLVLRHCHIHRCHFHLMVPTLCMRLTNFQKFHYHFVYDVDLAFLIHGMYASFLTHYVICGDFLFNNRT